MEIVKFSVRVFDGILEIIPEGGTKDNSIYEIRFKNLESISGQQVTQNVKVTTRLSPLFCDVESVRALIGEMVIDDNIILYHIREASRFAQYVKGAIKIKEEDVPFEVSMFTRYKAAHDCVLAYSVTLASAIGLSGKVGDVSFSQKETSKDIGKILDHLCKELKRWEDEVKGYKLEGRAKMVGVVRGASASPSFTPYGASLNRGILNNDTK